MATNTAQSSIAVCVRGPLPRMESSTVAINALTSMLAKARLMICGTDITSESVREMCRANGYYLAPDTFDPTQLARVQTLDHNFDIVVLDVTHMGVDFLKALEGVQSAASIWNLRPRILCFSTAHRNPQFVLRIERSGAKYIRVDSLPLLIEAVDVLFAEMLYLDRNGPCFEIIHGFSQGSCAPGEEISAVLLLHNSSYVQLRLPLAQRFVFDYLSQHRRIAVDSLQITSGLSAGWFYRDHAANSGIRQMKKIRQAAVKVLIQRIRDAMDDAFHATRLNMKAEDVLRSCLAEGSTRVLYRLNAEVRWRHPES